MLSGECSVASRQQMNWREVAQLVSRQMCAANLVEPFKDECCHSKPAGRVLYPNCSWLLLCCMALQVADCQVKLQRADKLIGGLGGERTRWSGTVQQLQADLDNLVGDVVLAAGEACWSWW